MAEETLQTKKITIGDQLNNLAKISGTAVGKLQERFSSDFRELKTEKDNIDVRLNDGTIEFMPDGSIRIDRKDNNGDETIFTPIPRKPYIWNYNGVGEDDISLNVQDNCIYLLGNRSTVTLTIDVPYWLNWSDTAGETINMVPYKPNGSTIDNVVVDKPPVEDEEPEEDIDLEDSDSDIPEPPDVDTIKGTATFEKPVIPPLESIPEKLKMVSTAEQLNPMYMYGSNESKVFFIAKSNRFKLNVLSSNAAWTPKILNFETDDLDWDEGFMYCVTISDGFVTVNTVFDWTN